MALSSTQRLVNEGSTPIYAATLVDEATDDPVVLADISSIELTYYDRRTGNIINSRDGQNINNTNDVTIHPTSGLLTWTLQPGDTVIVDTELGCGAVEAHIALFEWELTNGRRGKKEVRLDIVNLQKVGAD